MVKKTHTATSAEITARKLLEAPDELVKEYSAKWDRNENYALQQKVLDDLFTECRPCNRSLEDVLVKAALLNSFYGTNIYAIFPIAKHIVALDIDDRLAKGDETLVSDIDHVTINGKSRSIYSFATKYCGQHQPAKFPIYDRHVNAALRYYRDAHSFAKFTDAELRDYSTFKQVIVAFRQKYRLEKYDFRTIDRYLWQFGRELMQEKTISAERSSAGINAK